MREPPARSKSAGKTLYIVSHFVKLLYNKYLVSVGRMGWFDGFRSLFRRSEPEAPPPPPPPPDPRVIREQKRVELTMARNDAAQKQIEYEKLVPDETQKAKINQANANIAAYLEPKQMQFNYELQLFNRALSQVDALSNSATLALAQKYRVGLKQKHEYVANEYQKNKEKAFTQRRRFLDADPQEGVPGVGWFETIDDQILLVFWFCYTLFIGMTLSFVLSHFAIKIGSTRNMMIIAAILMILCIIVAHTFIKLYG